MPGSGAARPGRSWSGSPNTSFLRFSVNEVRVEVTVQAQSNETFAEIMERLQVGRRLEGCKGCTYRDADGTIHANCPRPLRSVSAFRSHDYTLVPIERYYALKGKRQID